MGKQKPVEETKVERCCGEECKKPEWKFGFCEGHYEEFKFGLVKKDGKRVSDYDKKLEHYLKYQKKIAAQKVA
jgi:hypothetical protein